MTTNWWFMGAGFFLGVAVTVAAVALYAWLSTRNEATK